ncbi:MAG: hypothetical protein K8H99_09165 [Nitrospirae bacterium]|nr:hypothetical protein [Fimbriimonadaceae bacterium]
MGQCQALCRRHGCPGSLGIRDAHDKAINVPQDLFDQVGPVHVLRKNDDIGKSPNGVARDPVWAAQVQE